MSGERGATFAPVAENGSLWKLKKAQTRDDLVRAALALFRRQGFERTTVEEIAAAARSSPRTFFRYFGSKEDLVFHDLPHHLVFLRTHLAEALGRQGVWDAVVDTLIAVVSRFLSGDADLAAERFEAWFGEPALRQRFVVLSMEFESAIADTVAASRHTKTEVDPYSRSVGIIGAASVRCAIESLGRAGFIEELRTLLDGIGDGLRHEPPPTSKARRAARGTPRKAPAR